MRLSRLFLSFGIVFALALTATSFAQEGGGQGQGRRGGQDRGGQARGMRGGFGGGTMSKAGLLRSAQVREELKVTEEQAKKVDEVLAAYNETRSEMFPRQPRQQRDPDMSEEERTKQREERAKQREEATKKMAELTKKTDKKLVAVLDKTQNKRLDQIILQSQGTDGLVSDFAVAALKLSKEQVEKIKAVIKTRNDANQELLASMRGQRGQGGQGGGRGGFEGMREKMTAIRETADKDALAVLNEEQQKALVAAKGEKFELERRSFRGRGGQGGGRGGQGGGQGGGQRTRPPVDDA